MVVHSKPFIHQPLDPVGFKRCRSPSWMSSESYQFSWWNFKKHIIIKLYIYIYYILNHFCSIIHLSTVNHCTQDVGWFQTSSESLPTQSLGCFKLFSWVWCSLKVGSGLNSGPARIEQSGVYELFQFLVEYRLKYSFLKVHII